MNLEFKQWVVGYALEANCREFVLWQGVSVHPHKLWAIKVQQRSIESMGIWMLTVRGAMDSCLFEANRRIMFGTNQVIPDKEMTPCAL